MVSTRVPFVEDAAKVFAILSQAERLSYGKTSNGEQRISSSNFNSNYQSIRELKAGTDRNAAGNNANQLIAASILLAIKGDHTAGPFRSGVSTKRDMGRALVRIGTDAAADGCLIGTEIMWMLRELETRGDAVVVLTESDILKKFADVVPLS